MEYISLEGLRYDNKNIANIFVYFVQDGTSINIVL